MTKVSNECNYTGVAYDEHIAKWGEIEWKHLPIQGTDLFELHDVRKDKYSEAEYEALQEDFCNRNAAARKLWEKEKREAFKYLADHIENWWD